MLTCSELLKDYIHTLLYERTKRSHGLIEKPITSAPLDNENVDQLSPRIHVSDFLTASIIYNLRSIKNIHSSRLAFEMILELTSFSVLMRHIFA